MDEVEASVDELLADLAQLNAQARQLATLASLAARFEPELLRALRLDHLPGADASAEADLWLSPLLDGVTAQFAFFRADVAQRLREELARDPARLDAVAATTRRLHAAAPRVLQLEEEVTYLSLRHPDDPPIGDLLDSVAAGVRRGRTGLARWAARALPQLPAPARETDAARRLVLASAPLLRGSSLANVDPDAVLSPADLPQVEIGLRLVDDRLHVGPADDPDAQSLRVPHTDPVMLMLRWTEGDREVNYSFAFVAGQTAGTSEVRFPLTIETLAGQRWSVVRPAPQRWVPRSDAQTSSDGIVVHLYRGASGVLLAWNVDDELDVPDFGVALLGDQAVSPAGDASQRIHRFDSFWASRAGDRSPEFLVSTYFRGPRANKALLIECPLAHERRAVMVAFTTGAKRSDAAISATWSAGRDRFEDAMSLLAGFLLAVREDVESSLCIISDTPDQSDIVEFLDRIGDRVRMVLCAPGDPKRPARLTLITPELIAQDLAVHGAQVSIFKRQRKVHGLTMIRLHAGRPVEVLTGSASATDASLERHNENLIRIADPVIASEFHQDFLALEADKNPPPRPWVQGQHVSVGFAHSPDWMEPLREAVRNARSSVFFALFGETAEDVIDGLVDKPEVLVMGIRYEITAVHLIRGRAPTVGAMSRPVPDLEQRSNILAHQKFVVIDFNDSDPIVFAGPTHLSFARHRSAGDRMLRIRDPHVARAFALEALRLVDQYDDPHRLDKYGTGPDPDWARHYFERTFDADLRRLLAGDLP